MVGQGSLFGRFNDSGKRYFIKMVHKVAGCAQLFTAANASRYESFFSVLAKRQAIDKEVPTMLVHL